ncbi:hypothetical protein [Halobacillus halophilus]|uniref:hypothetical protein n=1 Tax=Halobacillus halophilus TaxID=1570 RepID=UPI001CD3350A|nr:hypothetical protein [Halobacillus halophilus]MCA1010736.1 hypothetical protein [Halobacillus halophilus]
MKKREDGGLPVTRTILFLVVIVSWTMLENYITGIIHTYITSNNLITGIIYSLGVGVVLWIGLLILGKVESRRNREQS